MAKGDTFEDLLVWKKAMDLVVGIYAQCRVGSLSKDWGLRDQLQRAAVSIPANVAEGYERGSRKEYVQYLVIAKGSAGEIRCLLKVAQRLQYIESNIVSKLIAIVTEISRMLKGLINSLRTPSVLTGGE
jgi:four helix bundle protein